jgi:hypothetical protein
MYINLFLNKVHCKYPLEVNDTNLFLQVLEITVVVPFLPWPFPLTPTLLREVKRIPWILYI